VGERDGSALLFAAISLWFAGLLVLLGVSLFAWGLRDGWGGPNHMLESGGLLALGRFWVGLRWPLVLFVLPSLLAGLLLYRLDVRRSAGPPHHLLGPGDDLCSPALRLRRSFVSNPQSYPYATHLDTKFPALSLVDVPALVKACTDRWYNQTLCKVNDSVVRLGVMQGEYHWHKHDNDDEFFFVLEGHFLIDLHDRSIDLGPQEGFVVPKGVVHRTRAPERAVILMVETASIVPTGDD